MLDLPVGRNLQDHLGVLLMYTRPKPGRFHYEMRLDRMARNMIQAYLFGTGPFARQLNSANPMLRTDPRLAQPDIQLFSNPVKLSAHLWFPGLVKSPEHAFSADVILLPEIPFDIEIVCEKIRRRRANGRPYSMIVVAEGARPLGGQMISKHPQEAGCRDSQSATARSSGSLRRHRPRRSIAPDRSRPRRRG